MLPSIFTSELVVTSIASVIADDSRHGMNYFYNRPHHALIYKVSGTMACYYEDRCVEFTENEIVYIPRGMTYRSCQKSDGRYIIINFDTAAEYPADGIFVARFENHSGLYSLFSKCAEEWLFKDHAHRLNCLSYTYRVLAMLARSLSETALPEKRILAPAIEYMRLHIGDPALDTAGLAGAAGLCESQFRRLFKKVYLVSPGRYIGSVRIGQAKELLHSRSGITVGEAARITGFSDPESFTRLFKREVGMTPSAWRDRPAR